MLSRNIAPKPLISRALRFSTMVATEEFPVTVQLRPATAVQPTIDQATAECGVKIISRNYTSSIVSLKFSILGGSSTESMAQKGAAQLLATAAFAGNKSNSGIKIVKFLESLGATIDAAVDREHISYDLTVLPDKVEPAIATIMSAISSPPSSKYVLKEYKSTASLEYASLADDDVKQLKELIHEAAYGEASPLGASMYALNLSKLSVDEALQYRASHFVGSNIVLTANGISASALKAIVDEYGATLSAGTAAALPHTPYVGGDVKVRRDMDGELSYQALALPVPAGLAAKPFNVLQGVLASKIAELKLPKGALTPFFHSYASGGLLGFYAVGSAAEASSYLQMAVTALKSCSNQVETTAATKKIALSNFVSLEGACTTDCLLTAYKVAAPADAYADCRDVTSAQVTAAATTLLKSKPSFAILGITAGASSYMDLMKFMA